MQRIQYVLVFFFGFGIRTCISSERCVVYVSQSKETLTKETCLGFLAELGTAPHTPR